jgi:hypothetical protein
MNLKNLFSNEHYIFWCSLVMCEMLVKLVLYNYMFATYVNNYIFQLLVSGQFWGQCKLPHVNDVF